jgi:hypothetical protein
MSSNSRGPVPLCPASTHHRCDNHRRSNRRGEEAAMSSPPKVDRGRSSRSALAAYSARWECAPTLVCNPRVSLGEQVVIQSPLGTDHVLSRLLRMVPAHSKRVPAPSVADVPPSLLGLGEGHHGWTHPSSFLQSRPLPGADRSRQTALVKRVERTSSAKRQGVTSPVNEVAMPKKRDVGIRRCRVASRVPAQIHSPTRVRPGRYLRRRAVFTCAWRRRAPPRPCAADPFVRQDNWQRPTKGSKRAEEPYLQQLSLLDIHAKV